jgi:flagellar hook-associated protein FlgK
MVGELINLKAASQAYEASAQLVRVADQLDKTLLDGAVTTPSRSVSA